VTAKIANYGCLPVLRGRRIQAKQIGNLSEPVESSISVRSGFLAAEVSREAKAHTHKAVVSIGEFYKFMQVRIF